MARRYRKRWAFESVDDERVVVRWRNSRKVAHLSRHGGTPVMATVSDEFLSVVYRDRSRQWWLMKSLGAP